MRTGQCVCGCVVLLLSGRGHRPESVERLISSGFNKVLSRQTGLFERDLSQEMQHENMQGW